jgi:uncharacterized membrane protein YjdF
MHTDSIVFCLIVGAITAYILYRKFDCKKHNE